MGTISTNKLGALALMTAPLFTLIFYFLQPGGAFIDAADPADGAATIVAMVSNSTLAKICSVLIPVGLITVTYGIFAVAGNIQAKGNGDALSRMGSQMILVGVIGWVIASGGSLAIAGTSLPAEQAVGLYASLYGATVGIGTVAGLAAGGGFMVLALAVASRDDHNKIAALVAALAGVVAIVTTLIGALDNAQLETMTLIGGIVYIIHSVWFFMLGMDLLKAEAAVAEGDKGSKEE